MKYIIACVILLSVWQAAAMDKRIVQSKPCRLLVRQESGNTQQPVYEEKTQSPKPGEFYIKPGEFVCLPANPTQVLSSAYSTRQSVITMLCLIRTDATVVVAAGNSYNHGHHLSALRKLREKNCYQGDNPVSTAYFFMVTPKDDDAQFLTTLVSEQISLLHKSLRCTIQQIHFTYNRTAEADKGLADAQLTLLINNGRVRSYFYAHTDESALSD